MLSRGAPHDSSGGVRSRPHPFSLRMLVASVFSSRNVFHLPHPRGHVNLLAARALQPPILTLRSPPHAHSCRSSASGQLRAPCSPQQVRLENRGCEEGCRRGSEGSEATSSPLAPSGNLQEPLKGCSWPHLRGPQPSESLKARPASPASPAPQGAPRPSSGRVSGRWPGIRRGGRPDMRMAFGGAAPKRAGLPGVSSSGGISEATHVPCKTSNSPVAPRHSPRYDPQYDSVVQPITEILPGDRSAGACYLTPVADFGCSHARLSPCPSDSVRSALVLPCHLCQVRLGGCKTWVESGSEERTGTQDSQSGKALSQAFQ